VEFKFRRIAVGPPQSTVPEPPQASPDKRSPQENLPAASADVRNSAAPHFHEPTPSVNGALHTNLGRPVADDVKAHESEFATCPELLELPARIPLSVTPAELANFRQWATRTISKLVNQNRIGRSDAQERLQQWNDSEGWNTKLRDPLITILDLNAPNLPAELDKIGSKIHVKSREIPACDFADHVTTDAKLHPQIERLLRLSSCVPIQILGDGASMIIGSINPIVAAEVAELIEKTTLEDSLVPFVTPMRLSWNAWVARLEKYGF